MIKVTLPALMGALLCASGPAPAQDAASTATISLPRGKLAGEMLPDGTQVYRGIPYALPPVGSLRWRPPVPAPRWGGTRSAKRFGAACMQPLVPSQNVYADDPGPMSEDCLTLNVWVPRGGGRHPVMVWIHGGSLLTGTSSSSFYDGARLAREGVVVVTLNYRLGVFGFMAHPELTAESPHKASGNYGLLDQIEALKWVRSNVSAMGGDPGNVTIFGESAGALSVTYLLASPLARGLYAKAIAQSPYMLPTPPLRRASNGLPSGEQIGIAVGAALKAPSISALRALDATTLNALPPQGGPIPQATIDGWFLTKQLPEVFDAGEQARVPLIAGFNSGEIRALRGLAYPIFPDAPSYESYVRSTFGDIATKFLTLYPSTNVEESLLASTRDGQYGWSAQALADRQGKLGVPTYLYFFDHGYPATDDRGLHALHGAEIPYVFGAAGYGTPLPANWPHPPLDARERAMSDAMVRYWTSFAKTAQPRAAGQPDWRRYSQSSAYMAFSDVPRASHDLLPGHFALFDEVVCRRSAADQGWFKNFGANPGPLPVAPCRRSRDPKP